MKTLNAASFLAAFLLADVSCRRNGIQQRGGLTMINNRSRMWNLNCLAVLCVLMSSAPAAADTIVTFPDANLEGGVRNALGISAPTPITATAMLGLTSLSVPFTGITDLTGIQYATNLDKLWLTGNNFADLGPLAALSNLTFLTIDFNPLATNLAPLSGLSQLRVLAASENGISDITPLSGLTNLNGLELDQNLISDISPLKDLANLHGLQLMQNHITTIPVLDMPGLSRLGLAMNEITDISSLVQSNLPALYGLELQGNFLNQDAYEIYIPQLLALHPELSIRYDPAPEPGTCTLLGLGGLALTIARRCGLARRHAATLRTKDPHHGKECQ